jgi:hypothetical protein
MTKVDLFQKGNGFLLKISEFSCQKSLLKFLQNCRDISFYTQNWKPQTPVSISKVLYSSRTSVSSKQKKFRFEPKQDLFLLFHETKNKQNCFETNKNKPKQTDTTLNLLKKTKKCSLSTCIGWSSVCFVSIETSKLSVSV